jgi:hypothetical protein
MSMNRFQYDARGGQTMVSRLRARAGQASGVQSNPGDRRGVAAILAMMFLIMFGSLSAAMAIASRGNIVTASTNLHVMRAQSAAETGLELAEARLKEAGARFLMSDSDVTPTFGWDLWRGSLSGFSTYQIIPGKTMRQDLASPSGLAEAVAQAHNLDQNIVDEAGITTVTLGNAPAGTPATFKQTSWVFTPAVAVENQPADAADVPPLCYQITYAPLADGRDVRVIVTGYDFSYERNGQAITRQISKDFRLTKRVNHAIISPTRVMLGKNVQVTGDLGARFTDVSFNNGDPLILRSDFRSINAALDQKLNFFDQAVATDDADNDNRMRSQHTGESNGLTSATDDYRDNTGTNDSPYQDVTGDGFVDEYDIFLDHFDANNDNRVSRAEFTTAGGQLVDASLFDLIDSSEPDRNRNKVSGFVDANSNGRYEEGEVFLDRDTVNDVNRDQVLGYLDGYLDKRDRYVKVNGGLRFKVNSGTWETARGSLHEKLAGAIRPTEGTPPQAFNMSDQELPVISASNFATNRNDLQLAADGQPFATQVAARVQVPGASSVVVQELTPDANLDGLPDNNATAYFEKMPFNSPNFSDYYYRPVYRNMVFKNVEIPLGSNALFDNCWFIGVTWIRTHNDNTHILFGEYGKLTMGTSNTRPVPAVPRTVYGDDAAETNPPSMLPSTARAPSQMVLLANPVMDKGDIPSNQVGTYIAAQYNALPEPLIIGGSRITDTKTISNNIRFHSCLFVGSIVSDAPTGFTQVRNKLQFTGATRFVSENPNSTNVALNPDEDDKPKIATSSLMVPNYSVDIGSFNSPDTQQVQLKGAIIAGVMDVRGNADIKGALLLTFAPSHGSRPLVDVLGNPIGNPANFNTTLGYFGPDDGDSESLDPTRLRTHSGQLVGGWDTNGDGIADVPGTNAQPAGSTPVYWNGFGRINLRYDASMKLPSGIMLPMQYDAVQGSYREGYR